LNFKLNSLNLTVVAVMTA